MKLFVLTAILLTSVSAFAKKGTLYSADTCMRSLIACPQVIGTDFVSDQNGRCGCVTKKNYYSAEFCARAYIVCDAEKGYSYSTLTVGNNETLGCGCFKTK